MVQFGLAFPHQRGIAVAVGADQNQDQVLPAAAPEQGYGLGWVEKVCVHFWSPASLIYATF